MTGMKRIRFELERIHDHDLREFTSLALNKALVHLQNLSERKSAMRTSRMPVVSHCRLALSFNTPEDLKVTILRSIRTVNIKNRTARAVHASHARFRWSRPQAKSCQSL